MTIFLTVLVLALIYAILVFLVPRWRNRSGSVLSLIR